MKCQMMIVGLDYGRIAFSMAMHRLRKFSPKFVLVDHDIDHPPFPSEHFDRLISTKVLQHNTVPRTRLKSIVSEMGQVIRKNRALLVTVASTSHEEYRVGWKIASNTYEISEGRHKGVVQHYFEKDELRSLFEPAFKVSSIRPSETGSNWILTGNRRQL